MAFSDYTNPVVFWWQDLLLASMGIHKTGLAKSASLFKQREKRALGRDEQGCQRILPTTWVTMIGDRLQTGRERIQIKHQCLLGEGELAQKVLYRS